MLAKTLIDSGQIDHLIDFFRLIKEIFDYRIIRDIKNSFA